MSRFAAAIAAAAEQAPMSNGAMPEVAGRLLLADGDGLAYYCAGNDETSPGQSRANLLSKLASARGACGAERVKIVLTGQGSHKGFRYAVARVKPYQGHRKDQRRPNNWQYLREVLEEGGLADWIDTEVTAIAEADDLFSRYANGHPDCVLYTQDKDMRMVPGWHLDWLTHLLFRLEPGAWSVMHNEKLWGRAWFWSQMLHGDDADYIPGLPFYRDGSIAKSGLHKGEVKEIRCGEKSEAVVQMLPKCKTDMQALLLCRRLYESCYGKRWLVEILEQAILLWMRNDTTSSPFNVVAYPNPLVALASHAAYPAARAEIMQRIAESLVHEEAEDDRSVVNEDELVGIAGGTLRPVQAGVQGTGSGAGPRSLDGHHPLDPAPELQCPTGQDREQLPEVRNPQPSGIPAWGARLLAKA